MKRYGQRVCTGDVWQRRGADRTLLVLRVDDRNRVWPQRSSSNRIMPLTVKSLLDNYVLVRRGEL